MSNDGLKVLFAPGGAVVDIVFVHGLRGHREETWTAPTKPTKPKPSKPPEPYLWPRDFLPDRLRETPARILTYGYDADILGVLRTAAQGRLRDYGNMLVKELVYNRFEAGHLKRPIIFVAHSLGGLIVEKALLVSDGSATESDNQIQKCTYGVIFMGTPHVGSSLAPLGTFLTRITNFFRSTNQELMSVLQPASEVLADTQQSFHQMMARLDQASTPINLFCFYELVPTTGVGMVVEPHSAILTRYGNCGITSTHIDMVKYAERDDRNFMNVSAQIYLWTTAIAARQRQAPSTAAQPNRPARPVSTPNRAERRRVLRNNSRSEGEDENDEDENEDETDEQEHHTSRRRTQQGRSEAQNDSDREQQVLQIARIMNGLRLQGCATGGQRQYLQRMEATDPLLMQRARQLVQQQQRSSNQTAPRGQLTAGSTRASQPVLVVVMASGRSAQPSLPGYSPARDVTRASSYQQHT